MTRPLVLVYQEFAKQTPQVSEPDLDTLVIAPAYQIRDYEDDKTSIQVADYGTLHANNPYTPPVANTPAIVLAAPPDLVVGAWVDPTSVRVYFDDARVIMTSGSDGVSYTNDNRLTSATGAFVANGVAVGDTLIVANPAGPATPNLVYTITEVVDAATVRVTSNLPAANTGLAFRVERRLTDQRVGSSFVSLPVFRSSNEITILGGVTLTVGLIPRTVAYAKVYVGYRAYRTDLEKVDSITSEDEIRTKIGKVDARNRLAALVSVAKQNAGNAPIYFFGVASDDVTGYGQARDILSGNKKVYALVLGKADLAISALFRADNVSLADPLQALSNGVPQKFRAGLGSEMLVTTGAVVAERATAVVEQKSGAIPPGVRRASLVGATLLTAGVKPGDQLILSATQNGGALDGTYTISHLNSETELEVDTAFAATVAGQGGNYSIYRPSLGTTVVAMVESRANLLHDGVRFWAREGGTAYGARQIALVNVATTPNGIFSVVETSGPSGVTTINADITGGVTAQQIVDAIMTGTGVTTTFTGSAYLTATTSAPSTAQTALSPTALSTGTAGVNRLTTQALDTAALRLFDNDGTFAGFLTSGVQVGDIIEIPQNPTGSFTPVGTKRFVVSQVLSEQRIEIQNIVAGAYVNNSSTVEAELPHYDDRRGLGSLIVPGSTTIRYRIIRELTKDQQITTLATMAQSLRSQRAILAWPDRVEVADLVDGSKPRNVDGSAALADPQDGAFLAAVIGGMTAGLPNHQGFTRLGVAGIKRLYHSTGYFTEKQLSTLSDSGWYVFVQDTPESLPYTIHQLTTDPSALQTGEYSMVKNYDYLSKFYNNILEPFIGIWNVNEETLGFIRTAVDSGTLQLKSRRYARIGSPLKDGVITTLFASDAQPDRAELYLTLDRPNPLNGINLHLVG